MTSSRQRSWRMASSARIWTTSSPATTISRRAACPGAPAGAWPSRWARGCSRSAGTHPSRARLQGRGRTDSRAAAAEGPRDRVLVVLVESEKQPARHSLGQADGCLHYAPCSRCLRRSHALPGRATTTHPLHTHIHTRAHTHHSSCDDAQTSTARPAWTISLLLGGDSMKRLWQRLARTQATLRSRYRRP